jgi:fumarate reductase subunit C
MVVGVFIDIVALRFSLYTYCTFFELMHNIITAHLTERQPVLVPNSALIHYQL